MQLRRTLFVSVATTVALALTACGGDDPGQSPSPEPTATHDSVSPQPTEDASPAPSHEIPSQAPEPEDLPSAQDLLAAAGEVNPYQFIHVQIAAMRAATTVTTTTVDPQWDTTRVVHIDRTDPENVISYVHSEAGGEVSELVVKDGVRWERTDEGEWEQTPIGSDPELSVHDAAVAQAEQYESVELISPPDQLFRISFHDLGQVPAVMHVDNQLRPVRVESEGLEGYSAYTYDEAMEIPEVG